MKLQHSPYRRTLLKKKTRDASVRKHEANHEMNFYCKLQRALFVKLIALKIQCFQ